MRGAIRANLVIPTEVHTIPHENFIQNRAKKEGISYDESLRRQGARIPFEGRASRPEEVANLIVYLASNLASHTTGEIFEGGGYLYTDRNTRWGESIMKK